MKIRLILQTDHRKGQLRVKPQLPGRYYVELCGLDGRKLSPPAITGPLPSLDLIVQEAESIHTKLVAMRERHANDQVGELCHAAEAHQGDPRYDDTHPQF